MPNSHDNEDAANSWKELCAQYDVLGEDQQINKESLRTLVIESRACKGGRIFPTKLPSELQTLVLHCARQNGVNDPQLARQAVPRDGRFPNSMCLRHPMQVGFLEQRATQFFCNYRFCKNRHGRRIQLEDFTKVTAHFLNGPNQTLPSKQCLLRVHCGWCENLLHRGCGMYDTTDPYVRHCGWCRNDNVDEIQQRDLVRERKAYEDEHLKLMGLQSVENLRVFKYDKMPLSSFPQPNERVEKIDVECYLCKVKVPLPKQIGFPFHRPYSGFGGNTAKARGMKKIECAANTTLFAHNKMCHQVTVDNETHRVPLFETFKKVEATGSLAVLVYALSFTKVRLEAKYLTDDPFGDCALYFSRWKNYIEAYGDHLVLNELRNCHRTGTKQSGKKREREMAEMTDREDRQVEKKKKKTLETQANDIVDVVLGAVTKVVDAVKELLLEERRKPNASFDDEGFQEKLRRCIADSSSMGLGCQKKAFQLACMIQRRMLALPLLYKEVQRDADDVPNNNGNVQEPININSN
eukprot:scaffold5431_cov76-Cylindrotheca_fusiformis.AAC.1